MPTICDGLRRVQRLDLVGGLDALAADDEVVLAAQLAADFRDGGAHAARVFFVAEIEKGLGDKWSVNAGSCAAGRGLPALPWEESFRKDNDEVKRLGLFYTS